MKTMDNKYNFLIIDGSNLYHRSYHLGKVHSNLASGVIQESLKAIDKLIDLFAYDTSEIYFLFDNTQSQINLRKQIDPEYKSNREKSKEEDLFRFHSRLIEVLKVRDSRYRILMAGTLEADDLVKPLIKILKLNLYTKAIMISNDLDWTRNLSSTVHWYDWINVYDSDLFYSKYKFFPSEEGLKLFKAIKGDPSDHIYCSVHNFPQDMLEQICNAAYHFNSFYDFENYITSLPDIVQLKIRTSFKEIKRNYMLVDFAEIEKPIEEYIRICEFNKIKLLVFLSSLGLKIPDKLKSNEELIEDFFIN